MARISPRALRAARIFQLVGGNRGMTAAAPPTGYAGSVLADAPVLYIPMNNSDGVTFNDLSGNDYHFARAGAPDALIAAGTIGSPIASEPVYTVFSGYQAPVTRAHVPVLSGQLTNNATLEVWVRCSPGQVHAYGIFFSYPKAGALYHGVTMHHSRSTGALTARINSASAGASDDVADSHNYMDDAWYHLVLVRRGDRNELWRNGVKVVDALRGTGSAPIEAPDSSLYIGAGQAGAYPFTGAMMQLALYNKALDPARIAAHYAARLIPG